MVRIRRSTFGFQLSAFSVQRSTVAPSPLTNRHSLWQREALSISKTLPPGRYLGMQTLTLTGSNPNGRLLETRTSLRLRAFRFLSERHTQRERPSVVAEFFLFAVIVLTATWSMFPVLHAMRLIR